MQNSSSIIDDHQNQQAQEEKKLPVRAEMANVLQNMATALEPLEAAGASGPASKSASAAGQALPAERKMPKAETLHDLSARKRVDDLKAPNDSSANLGGSSSGEVEPEIVERRFLRPPPAPNDNSEASGSFLDLTLAIIEARHARAQRTRTILVASLTTLWVAIAAAALNQLGFFWSGEFSTIETAAVAAVAVTLPIIFLIKCLDFVFRTRSTALPAEADSNGVDGVSMRLLLTSMRDQIAASTDILEQVMVRSSDIESFIRTEVRALETATRENDSRMRGIVGGFAKQRDAASNHIVQVGEEARAMTEILMQTSHAAVKQLKTANEEARGTSETLMQTSHEVIKQLKTSREEACGMTEILMQTSRAAVKQLETGNEEALAVLLSTCKTVGASLKTMKERLEDDINDVGASARRQLVQVTSDTLDYASVRSAAIVEAISASGTIQIDALTSAARAGEERIASASQEAGATMADAMERIASESHEVTLRLRSSLEKTVQESTASFAEAFSTAVDVTTRTLTQRTDDIKNILEEVRGVESEARLQMERLSDLVKSLQDSGPVIASSINESAVNAQNAIHDSGKAVITTIASRGKSINDAISRSTESIMHEFEKGSRDLELLNEQITRITSASHEDTLRLRSSLEKTVQESTAAFAEAFSTTVDLTTRTITQRTDDIKRILEEVRGVESETRLQMERLSDVVRSMQDSGPMIASSINESAISAQNAIHDSGKAVITTIASRSKSINDTISSSTESVMHEFEKGSKRLEFSLNEQIKRIGILKDAVVKACSASEKSVESSVVAHGKKLAQLNITFATQIHGAGAALGDIGSKLDRFVAEGLQEFDALMEQRVGIISEKIGDIITSTIDNEFRVIADRDSQLNALVSARTEKFETLIEFDDELTRRADARLSGMVETIRSSVDAALACVRESEQHFMQQGARLVRLHELLNDQLGKDHKVIEGQVVSLGEVLETQAQSFEQLLGREEDMSRRLLERLRATAHEVMAAATNAESRLYAVDSALKERAKDLLNAGATISSELRFHGNETAERRQRKNVKFLGQPLSDSASDLPKRGKPEVKATTESLKKNGETGWLSALLERASQEDARSDGLPPRRGNRSRKPEPTGQEIVASIASNIDLILDESSAYDYWCNAAVERRPLRPFVSDFGYVIFQYLEENSARQDVVATFRDNVSRFRSEALRILAEHDYRVLLQYLLTPEGRTATVLSEFTQQLMQILESLSRTMQHSSKTN